MNNSSFLDGRDQLDEPLMVRQQRIILVTMLSVFSFVGLVGNAIAFYIFYRRSSTSQSTFVVFILALAGIDFINCLVTIPFTVVFELLQYQLVYDLVCKTYMFLITSTVPFSAYIMVGIAVDRYLCICHPLLHVFTVSRAKMVILLLTIPAFVFGILTALSFGTYGYVEHSYRSSNGSHVFNYTGEALDIAGEGQEDTADFMSDGILTAFLSTFYEDGGSGPADTDAHATMKSSVDGSGSAEQGRNQDAVLVTTMVSSVWSASSSTSSLLSLPSPLAPELENVTSLSSIFSPVPASSSEPTVPEGRKNRDPIYEDYEIYNARDNLNTPELKIMVIGYYGECVMNHVIFSAHFAEVYKKVHALNFLIAFVIVVILYTLIYKSIITRRANKEARRNKNYMYASGRNAGGAEGARENGKGKESHHLVTSPEDTQSTCVVGHERKGSGSIHSSPACTATTNAPSRTASRASSRTSADSRRSAGRALKVTPKENTALCLQTSETAAIEIAKEKNVSQSPTSSPTAKAMNNQPQNQLHNSLADLIDLSVIGEGYPPKENSTEETDFNSHVDAPLPISSTNRNSQIKRHSNARTASTAVTNSGVELSNSPGPDRTDKNGSTKAQDRQGSICGANEETADRGDDAFPERDESAEERPLISTNVSGATSPLTLADGADKDSSISPQDRSTPASSKRFPAHNQRPPKKSSRKLKGEKREVGYKKVVSSSFIKHHKEGSAAANSIKRKRPCNKHQMYVANIKTALMLLVVTTVFIVAFLPSLLMANGLLPTNLVMFYSYFVYHVANPFIYAFMNQNFRDDLKKIISAACRRR